VHGLAIRLSRVTDAKGRIIFSGMRLGDLAERIRGLLKATRVGPKLLSEADACLAQLDTIGTQRNKLVHRFVMYHDDAIWVTNLPIAKSEASMEYERLSLVDLSNMYIDCNCITLRLTYIRRKKPDTK